MYVQQHLLEWDGVTDRKCNTCNSESHAQHISCHVRASVSLTRMINWPLNWPQDDDMVPVEQQWGHNKPGLPRLALGKQ